MTQPMIRLDSVAFAYPGAGFGFELDSLEVEARSRVACIGPSGTGKTTLVNLVAGILSPARGSIRVDGQDLSGMDDAARRAWRSARVGMVFQEFELMDYLSTLDNVLVPFLVSPALQLDAGTRARADELLGRLGIAHTRRRRPSQLSQGERQRVALGRALIAEPALLMCDEPTGNLDPQTTERLLDLLFEQVDDHDATLLMVTHDHGLLDRFDAVIDLREVARPLDAAAVGGDAR